MTPARIAAFGALILASSGCSFFVDPNAACHDGSCPLGQVCDPSGVCVVAPANGSTASSSSSASSGATSTTEGSSSASSSSSSSGSGSGSTTASSSSSSSSSSTSVSSSSSSATSSSSSGTTTDSSSSSSATSSSSSGTSSASSTGTSSSSSTTTSSSTSSTGTTGTTGTFDTVTVNNSGRYGASLVTVLASAGNAPRQFMVGGTLGGPSSSTYDLSVAEISDGGAVRTVVTNGLVVGRRHAVIMDLGPTVYALGGEDGQGGLISGSNDEESDGITPGGAPGGFSSSSNHLMANRAGASVAVVPVGTSNPNPLFAYVVGGWDATRHPMKTEVSKFDPNLGGSPSAFSQPSWSTPVPRVFAGMVAVNGTLYVVGGAVIAPDGGIFAETQTLSASIWSDGGLGTFAPVAGMDLNGPHVDPAVYVDPGTNELVVMGGFTDVPDLVSSPTPTASVEVAPYANGYSGFRPAHLHLTEARGGLVGTFMRGASVAEGGLTRVSGNDTTTDDVETANQSQL
ncbi:MAG: hypothetical protein JST54_02740 [Deltaproteobacteria bacterium]|nr:hypothetical protein [Deltaproteobacteria bacterium]